MGQPRRDCCQSSKYRESRIAKLQNQTISFHPAFQETVVTRMT